MVSTELLNVPVPLSVKSPLMVTAATAVELLHVLPVLIVRPFVVTVAAAVMLTPPPVLVGKVTLPNDFAVVAPSINSEPVILVLVAVNFNTPVRSEPLLMVTLVAAIESPRTAVVPPVSATSRL